VTAESDEDGKTKAGDTTTMTMTMTAKKGGLDDEDDEEEEEDEEVGVLFCLEFLCRFPNFVLIPK
jgi:hypothetical protein